MRHGEPTWLVVSWTSVQILTSQNIRHSTSHNEWHFDRKVILRFEVAPVTGMRPNNSKHTFTRSPEHILLHCRVLYRRSLLTYLLTYLLTTYVLI